MVVSNNTRPHPAQLKVIGLGLPRTGTSSLRDALDLLGFGPCYHMTSVLSSQGKDCKHWWKVHNGDNPVQAIDTVVANHKAIVDFPGAMYPEIMYDAFPQSKYILTVRSPEKWHTSVKNTLLQYQAATSAFSFVSPSIWIFGNWTYKTIFSESGFHKGRFLEDGIEHFEAHNAKVNAMIPKEQLLVLEAGKDGWEPLCNFLGVPVPDVPFPHANDTQEFQARTDAAARFLKQCMMGGVVGFGVVAAVGWQIIGHRAEWLVSR